MEALECPERRWFTGEGQRHGFRQPRWCGSRGGRVMCAIVGIQCDVRDYEWGQTHSLMTQLLVEAAERGIDACGFAASTEPYDAPHKGRIVADKEALPSPEFVQANSAWRRL